MGQALKVGATTFFICLPDPSTSSSTQGIVVTPAEGCEERQITRGSAVHCGWRNENPFDILQAHGEAQLCAAAVARRQGLLEREEFGCVK
jgi:hypothetical protein